MPRRNDIQKILVIGSGPIVIGQSAEFDYSGTQACKALRQEGYEVVLVNSNPATIMTDPELADRTYIEPLTREYVEEIIRIESEMLTSKPGSGIFALLPTVGGQTALNLAVDLADAGILDKYNVELIGAKLEAIKKAEDRLLFKDAMIRIGLDVSKSALVNNLLARLPFLHITVTAESLRKTMASVAQKAGEWFLHFVQDTAGGLFGAVTSAIIFLYVFVALLTNRDKLLTLIRQLNPLGEDVTDLYLRKMGSMVRGTVTGQFVIALCQGVAGAASVYVAGFHHGFFIFAILLTALSIIPLGGGIVTIPFGIGMMFYGNIIGGAFVVLWHLAVVTNLDNFLRPILVPRDARLNPALMLLAVFAGIAMFGPWGIVIGPVLMIVIVTTIDVYLAVYKGVELQESDDQDDKPGWLTRWNVRRAAKPAAP